MADISVLDEKLKNAKPKDVPQLQTDNAIAQKQLRKLERVKQKAARKNDAAKLALDEFTETYIKKVDPDVLKKSAALVQKQNEVLNAAKKEQAKLVKALVESDHKVKLAKATLQHAKHSGETKVMKSASKLLAAAEAQNMQAKKEVAKSAQDMEDAAHKLQKIAKEHAGHMTTKFKNQIAAAVKETKKMRKKALLLRKAQELTSQKQKKAADRYARKSKAAADVAYKAERKAIKAKAYAAKLRKGALEKEKKYGPLLEFVAKVERDKAHYENELKLARHSESADAISIAQAQLRQATAAQKSARHKLARLGMTPKQMRTEADVQLEQAQTEEGVEAHADAVAHKEQIKFEGEKAMLDKSKEQIDHINKVFLPKMTRHLNKQVALIEHKLAKELAALGRLGVLEPSPDARKAELDQATGLEKKVLMQREAARVRIASLRNLRLQLNTARTDAETALKTAKVAEEKTHAADKTIVELKKKACDKAQKIETVDLPAASKDQKKPLEVELAAAQKACQKAAESLAAAREELNKRADAVKDAAQKAKQLEADYAAADERILANKVNSAAEDSAEESMLQQSNREKLKSVRAMITDAETRESDAHLMLEAAEHRGDKEQIEIAKASGTAAAHHLEELKREKIAIMHNMTQVSSELGELHSAMEAGTAKMHEAAHAAGQAQLKISSEVQAATAEGSSSLMQRKVDQLTLELGRHLGEEQKLRADRQHDSQDVAQLHAKINAIDGAAADLIKMLEAAITKSNAPVNEESKNKEVTRLTKDMSVAASKAAQLAKLSVVANKKVAAAKANLNKAKDKKAAAKAYLAAKKDAAAVKAAAKKVDSMEADDKAKISAVKADTTDTEKAVAAFAKRLKEKMVRITQLGNNATRISNLAGNTGAEATLTPAKEKEYHDRITALEAAVAQFGGVEQVALVEKQKPGSNATAAVDKEKKKLLSVETKIGNLQKEYSKAEESDDHDTMIKVGTEMKDMEEEATTIREKLKATYGVVMAPSPVDNLSDANSTVASLESVKKKFQAAVATAKEASKKRAKLMKAEADARLKFNQAARVEHKKIEEANKAKAGLAAQMAALKKKEHAEKGRVDAMKMKLNAEAAALAKQEKDAAAKREMVKKKLVETEKEYSKNVGHLQSADTDAKVAVNVASKTLVGDFDEKTRAAAVGATAPAANATRLR